MREIAWNSGFFLDFSEHIEYSLIGKRGISNKGQRKHLNYISRQITQGGVIYSRREEWYCG